MRVNIRKEDTGAGYLDSNSSIWAWLKLLMPILLAFLALTSSSIARHVEAIGISIVSGSPFSSSGENV